MKLRTKIICFTILFFLTISFSFGQTKIKKNWWFIEPSASYLIEQKPSRFLSTCNFLFSKKCDSTYFKTWHFYSMGIDLDMGYRCYTSVGFEYFYYKFEFQPRILIGLSSNPQIYFAPKIGLNFQEFRQVLFLVGYNFLLTKTSSDKDIKGLTINIGYRFLINSKKNK